MEATKTPEKLPVLMTAAAVRKLSRAEAERALPVRLGAVVTFYDRQTDCLFVQDRTAGIFVQNAHGTNLGLRVGRLLELEGVTQPGPFGPVLSDPTIRVQGKGRLPPARLLTAESLFAGTEDAQWVEVQGIVNSISVAEEPHWLELDVAVLDDIFKAHLPGFTKTNALPTWLVDARIKLRGVARTASSRRGRTLGFEMFVPSIEPIQVLQPAPADPFALPGRAITAVLQPDSTTPPGHRVKVQGVVTLKWSDRQIYLQDATGGIYAELLTPLSLQPGAQLEVVGFPRPVGLAAQLRQSEWRLVGEAPPVAPVQTRAGDMRQGDRDSMLVELEAVLAGQVQHQGIEVLTLQQGQWSFEAHLQTNRVTKALAALHPGSRLRVTGVCDATVNERQRRGGFRLLLRSPDDVVLLASPPWWTVPRALTVLALVTLGAGIWLLLYAKRVSALEHKYSQLFENASDLVCSLDLQGRFTALNKAGARITGYAQAEARGRSFEDWVAPDHRTVFRGWWTGLLAGQATPAQELSIAARDGHEVALEISGRLVRQRRRPLAIEAIARDITARKEAEEQRLLMERKMLDSQKLESLGVLAGGIAHDFNNLLTAILGNATLAGQAVSEDSSQRSHLRNIEKASRQAADLCQQLLAYSGKGRFIIQRINLNALIEDMRQLLHISVSKKAVLEIEASGELPAIEADPSQIRQVLLNLVINASEALDEKNGLIRIRTGGLQADRSSLAEAALASDLAPGHYVFLEVSDTGCGMDRETLGKIFDPFFTTKFIGRGLGLAAVSGIVRAHRGALHITSEPARGSTFRILLPCCGQAPEPIPVPPSASVPWRGSGTVLLADDEEAVRLVTSHMLRSLGFEVILAANGQDAVASFRAQANDIVAVVLDLTMPRLSGEEALREIRRIRPEAPVLLMSGFSEQDAMKRCASQGASDFLPKPFKPEELRRKLQALLEAPPRGHEETELASIPLAERL